MRTINIEQTFWEKDHMRILPVILKHMLLYNTDLRLHDPDTDKVITLNARRIAEVCEYDPQHDEYVFPVSICS